MTRFNRRERERQSERGRELLSTLYPLSVSCSSGRRMHEKLMHVQIEANEKEREKKASYEC